MSNDLISRSALLQKFQEDKEFLQKGLGRDAEYAYISADSVIEKIKLMPTAYDVDKVVEQIDGIMKDESIRFVNQAVNRAKIIVKSGGIE